MALVLIQPLTEMSTRNISLGDKVGRCVGLTILPPSFADCLGIWDPQPPGTLRPSPGQYRDYFNFYTFLTNTELESNPGLLSEKSVTNSISHGTAI